MTIEEKIAAAYNKARNKHPKFADDEFEALAILTEEVGEVAKALNENNPELENELYDVIAVCLRWLKGDIDELRRAQESKSQKWF